MNDQSIYSKTFNDEEEKKDDLTGAFLINLSKLVGGLIVLPAVIYGTLFYYLLLRKFKQRFSVSLLIAAVTLLLCLGLWSIGTISDDFIYAVSNPFQIGDTWREALPGAMIIQWALGTLIGLVVVGMSIYQMKANPHRLKIAGNWMYKFVFNRTPWGVVLRKKKIEALKNGTFSDEEKSPLGLDENFKRDTIAYRYMEESVQHTIITGAAGSGKTVTELSLMLSDIKMNRSFVVIDFKKSPEFAAKLSAWCEEYGRDFYHFVNGKPENYDVKHSLGQCTYDPLAGASPTARADMILGMRAYDDRSEIYKNYMVQLLQVLFNAIDKADRSLYEESYRETKLDAKEKSSKLNKIPKIVWDKGGIHQLASVISSKVTLDSLADACVGTDIEDDIREVAESYGSKNGLGNSLNELRGQMRTITASEYGKWMKTGGEERSIDLTKVIMGEGNVVLFSINSDTEPAFAKNVGTLIFSDLNSVSSNLRETGDGKIRSIYVDEFQAVHPTTVKSLLEKARESRLAVTLAQQSLDQVASSVDKNGESYLNAILDTCSNFIVHAGSTETSARRLSEIIGKEWVTKYTQSNSNESFLFSLNFWNKRKQVVQTSEEERPIAPTRMFMDLSMPNSKNGFRSTAVLVNKASFDPLFKGQSGGKAREIWMIPDDKVVAKYFVPKMVSERSNPKEKFAISEVELRDESVSEPESIAKESSETPKKAPSSTKKRPSQQQQARKKGASTESTSKEPKPRQRPKMSEPSEDDFIIEEISEDGEPDDDMGMEFFNPPPKSEEDERIEKLIAERDAKRERARNAAAARRSSGSKGSQSSSQHTRGKGLGARRK